MSHLSLEMLARLVDEAPTALEAAHLAACAPCRAELQQLHEQTSALSALPELEAPADEWERIERRLRNEGLIRGGRGQRAWLHTGLRAAAALALLATGTLLGRAMGTGPQTSAVTAAGASAPEPTAPVRLADHESGQTSLPERTDVAATPDDMAAAAEARAERDFTDRESAERGADARQRAEPGTSSRERPASPLRLASNDSRREPRTSDEALEQLRTAELSYLDALTRFAEFSGNTAAGDPAARLAALEGIVLTTRAALGQAPTDPVINGYHLTALAQRDATLRQIASTNSDSWF